MSDDEVNWPEYLAKFHSERAGVAEAVLSRAMSSDHTPYRWLARAVSADARTVVDLASGSGPMSRELARPGRTVVGLDLSEREIAETLGISPGAVKSHASRGADALRRSLSPLMEETS